MKNIIKLTTIACALLVFISSCKKDEDNKINNASLACIDSDGNSYKTVKIGDQIWMAENLRTTKLNDGSEIPYYYLGSAPFVSYYLWYENNKKYDSLYGKLYNQYAVHTGKLAPKGWHIPSDEDWLKLITYLGGASVAGGKMKVNYNWVSPNVGASNSSEFSAYGAGLVVVEKTEVDFFNMRYETEFWSSTIENDSYGVLHLDNDKASADLVNESKWDKRYLMISVRCVKD